MSAPNSPGDFNNPKDIGSKPMMNKALSLNVLKRYQESLEVCEAMIEKQESFAEAHYQKAIALNGLGRANEALQALQLATGYKQEYYEALMLIGDILINYERYSQAIDQVYKRVLEFRNNDFMASLNTAKCYHFMNQNDNAEI